MSAITGVAPTLAPTLAAAGPGTALGATATVADAQRHARLVNAAQEFEGMLLEQILKPLQKSQDSGFGQDPDSDRDPSLDTLSSYGTEAVANAIAKSGGLGIARKLVADVSRIDTRTQPAPRSQVTEQTEKERLVLKSKVPPPMR